MGMLETGLMNEQDIGMGLGNVNGSLINENDVSLGLVELIEGKENIS